MVLVGWIGATVVATCFVVAQAIDWWDLRTVRRRALEVAREMEGDATIMAVGNGRYSREARKDQIVDREKMLDTLIDTAPALPCGFETPRALRDDNGTAVYCPELSERLSIEDAEGYAFALLRAVREAKRG